MPIISMFYGIIIRLYVIDNVQHGVPAASARQVRRIRGFHQPRRR